MLLVTPLRKDLSAFRQAALNARSRDSKLVLHEHAAQARCRCMADAYLFIQIELIVNHGSESLHEGVRASAYWTLRKVNGKLQVFPVRGFRLREERQQARRGLCLLGDTCSR